MPSMDALNFYSDSRPGGGARPARADDLGPRQPDHKVCKRCAEDKTITDFPATSFGWSEWCKACWAAYRAQEAAPVPPAPPVTAAEPFRPDADDVAWLEGKTEPGPLELLTNNKSADVYAAEVQNITANVLPAVIETDEQQAQVTELLARGKAAAKGLELARKAAVDPLNAQVKRINSAFKPLTEALDSLEEHGKRTLLAYLQHRETERRREREEAQRRQQEAAEREAKEQAAIEAAATVDERHQAIARADDASREQMHAAVDADALARPVRGVRTDTGSASVVERWTVEVVDAALVPRQYLTVDQKALRAAVAEGVRHIPGCVVSLVQGLAVRG